MVLSFVRKGSLVMLQICAGVHNLIALMNPLVDYGLEFIVFTISVC